MASQSRVRVCVLAAIGLVGVLGLTRATPAWAEMDEAKAQEMLEKLKSPDPRARHYAIVSLEAGKYRPAIEAIKKAVFDENSRVANRAVECLVNMGDTSIVPALAKRLKTGDISAQKFTATALGRFGDPRAGQPLLDAFGTARDARLRSCLVKALGQVADKTVMLSILKKLASGKKRQRTERYWNQDGTLLLAFRHMIARGVDVSPAIGPMIGILKNQRIYMLGRAEAAEVLLDIGGDRATQAVDEAEKKANRHLKRLLGSARADSTRRKQLAAARVEREKKRAEEEAREKQKNDAEVAAAVKASRAKDAKTRGGAMHFLARRSHHPAAIKRMAELLADPHPYIRANAAKYLSYSVRTPATAEKIKKLLVDPVMEVREMAAEVLGYPLKDVTAAGALRKLLSDPKPRVRGSALRALAIVSKGAARDVVLKGLVDREPVVRDSAGRGLRYVGPLDASHIPALMDALSMPRVHFLVPSTLAKMGPAAVAPALAYLRDGKDEKRHAGARAINVLLSRGIVTAESLKAAGPGLVALAGSEHPGARLLAIDLLAKIDMDQRVTAIIAALDAVSRSGVANHDIAIPRSLTPEQGARIDAALLSIFKRTPLLKRPVLLGAVGRRGNWRAIEPVVKTIEGFRAYPIQPEESLTRADAARQRRLPTYIETGIETLGHIGGPKAVAAIKRYIKTDDKVMRAVCLRALGLTGEMSVAAELRDRLTREEYQDDAMAAAEGLALLGDMQSLKRILKMIGSASRQQSYAARKACVGFFGPVTTDADADARRRIGFSVRAPFTNVPLRGAAKFIAGARTMNVVVNYRALAPLGIRAEYGVTPPVGENPAAYTFMVMLANHDTVDKLGFRWTNGVLYVTSAKHLARLPSLDKRAWDAMGASGQTALMKPVEIDAKIKPVSAVIMELARKSGVKIALADAATTEGGLDSDAKIDLVVKKLPLCDALLMAWLQGGATTHLAMVARNGTIILGPGTSGPVAVKPTGGTTTKRPAPKVPAPAAPSKNEKLAADKLKLGDLYKQVGRLDKARKIYQAIIKDYPETQTAQTAKKRLESMGK